MPQADAVSPKLSAANHASMSLALLLLPIQPERLK